jgi:hypothetical protein
LAARLAAATICGPGRSCFEAGAPLQLTVDAPGAAELRVGVRLGDTISESSLEGLVPTPARQPLVRLLAHLPSAEHESLGAWLFWTRSRQSIFVDLRDRSPRAAFERLHHVLSPAQRARLAQARPPESDARPWVFRCETDDHGAIRVHVLWLIAREASARDVVERIAPGCFDAAMGPLGHLVRRPGASGRFVLATPLDEGGEPALRIGNTAWRLAPEDDDKHRAVGRLMSALGGPRDYAEALWSLCRGAARPQWHVGRACEVKVDLARVRVARARLFFSPDV